RGFVPDDTPFEENVFQWLVPLYSVYTEEEERLSAQLAAAEMLKSGTTAFLEAGTVGVVHAPVDRRGQIGSPGRHRHGGCGTSRPSRRSTARPPTRPWPTSTPR